MRGSNHPRYLKILVEKTEALIDDFPLVKLGFPIIHTILRVLAKPSVNRTKDTGEGGVHRELA